MSEPQPPPPPKIHPPFRPEVVRSPINPGCGKPLAVGCGLLLLLLVVGLTVTMSKRFAILGWTLEVMQPEVERRLPADLPAPERARMAQAFSRAVAKARSGAIDLNELSRVQRSFMELSQHEKLTAEAVRAFVEVLETFADGPRAGSGEAPESP